MLLLLLRMERDDVDDDAQALLVFIEAITEKTLRSTVVCTAARGRGKSASLGLAVACAVAMGYSNIFVTSPHPDNLRTFFDFVLQGFDALAYKEHQDYELLTSTDEAYAGCVVRVNVHHTHRQTIQYVHPAEGAKVGHAELVVVDEAAAIPLPMVRALFGPHLLFLSSTVNGYEGTGRALSLKLIKVSCCSLLLGEQPLKCTRRAGSEGLCGRRWRAGAARAGAGGAHPLQRGRRSGALAQPPAVPGQHAGPARGPGCSVAVCDKRALLTTKTQASCPHPSTTSLYYVNKDALFSFHKASETFLQRMVALFVSSHYKARPRREFDPLSASCRIRPTTCC